MDEEKPLTDEDLGHLANHRTPARLWEGTSAELLPRRAAGEIYSLRKRLEALRELFSEAAALRSDETGRCLWCPAWGDDHAADCFSKKIEAAIAGAPAISYRVLFQALVEEAKAALGGLLEAEECETCVEEDSNGRCENDDDDGQDCPCHGRIRKAKEEGSRFLSELIPGGKYGGA